jgi:hypothetical protein
MKIRIIKPEINSIQNDWGYEYDYSDTVEIELNDFPRWLIDSVSFEDEISFNEETMLHLKNIPDLIGQFLEAMAKELSIDDD